jgi:hypothetical protein
VVEVRGAPATSLETTVSGVVISRLASSHLNHRYRRNLGGMCRNIRTLHNFQPPATSDEVSAAALQYVRKVSGTTKPSQANREAFDRAVHEVAHATQHLLESLVTTAPPKDREVEAEKARARAALRYGT